MDLQKLVVLATACIFAVACSQSPIPTNEATMAAATRAAATAQAAIDPDAAYRPWPTWHYDSRQDDMTGKPIYWAAVSSKEVFNLDFPYEGKQSATFAIRVHPGGQTDLMLTIARGQFICIPYSDNGCPIKVRFGNGDMRIVQGTTSNDQSTTVAFLPDDQISVHDIAKAGVLRIGIPLYQSGDHVFTFDVSSLDTSKLGLPLPRETSHGT